MIKKAETFTDDIRPQFFGGQGEIRIRNVVTDADLNGKGRLFGKITLEPGCSIGYHVHERDSEIFYVLEGEPVYNDGGVERRLLPGDVTVCSVGTGHAIANPTDRTVVVMAVIVYA